MAMIKLTALYALPAITDIVNKSLLSGIFPNSRKRVVINPIPKKSNIEEFVDLKPIDILSALSKIVKKAVVD